MDTVSHQVVTSKGECSLDDALVHLSTLEDNWDGYGAHPITDAALQASAHALSSFKTGDRSDAPPPWLMPSNDGGLIFEWEFAGEEKWEDMWIEVKPDGRADIYLEISEDDVPNWTLEPPHTATSS